MSNTEDRGFSSLSKLILYIVKKYKYTFFFTLLFGTMGHIAWMTTNTALKHLIDALSITQTQNLKIFGSILFYVITIFSIHAFWYLSRIFYSKLGPFIEQDVRMLTFSRVKNISINYFKKNGDGFVENFVDCLSEGVECIFWTISSSIIPGCAIVLYAITKFFFIHPICGSIYCLMLMIYIFVSIYIIKQSANMFSKQTMFSHRRTNVMIDAFKNIITLKIFGLHHFYHNKVLQLHQEETNYGRLYRTHTAKFEVAQCIFSIASFLMMSVFTYMGIKNHSISVGKAIEILGMSAVLAHSISEQTSDLVEMIQYYAQAKLSIKLIKEADLEHHFGNKLLVDTKGDIVIKNLDFSYENRTIIKNLNLTIPQNKIIVIVGPSGTGKSTILNIIAQLINVNPHTTFINDHDLTTLEHKAWLQKISYLTQRDTILDATIYENIALDHDLSRMEDVQKAAQLAEIHHVIDKLENKYETKLGTNGINLSGGQIKRLCLARSFMNLDSKEIILCDEPTNSLDLLTAKQIIQIISHVKDKTVLIVDHSLHAIAISDFIIFIQDLEHIFMDTHTNLLANNSIYKSFFDFKY